MPKRSLELTRKYQKVSLTLYLKQPAYDRLTKLVDISGAGSKAEVVRAALELYEQKLTKGE